MWTSDFPIPSTPSSPGRGPQAGSRWCDPRLLFRSVFCSPSRFFPLQPPFFSPPSELFGKERQSAGRWSQVAVSFASIPTFLPTFFLLYCFHFLCFSSLSLVDLWLPTLARPLESSFIPTTIHDHNPSRSNTSHQRRSSLPNQPLGNPITTSST
ncbi:hypothetical protein B0I37DRAFT_381009 [Chaetomium sp. MPI-CAGE-AT-0009]|nr:hypothetical protein B0I37DRAFT_381009 [Chaetomium sp. MPI-CAGE-AT-0009]